MLCALLHWLIACCSVVKISCNVRKNQHCTPPILKETAIKNRHHHQCCIHFTSGAVCSTLDTDTTRLSRVQLTLQRPVEGNRWLARKGIPPSLSPYTGEIASICLIASSTLPYAACEIEHWCTVWSFKIIKKNTDHYDSSLIWYLSTAP